VVIVELFAIAAREGHVDFETSHGRWPAEIDVSNGLLFSWKKQKIVLRYSAGRIEPRALSAWAERKRMYFQRVQTTTREASLERVDFFHLDSLQPFEKPRIDQRNPRKSKDFSFFFLGFPCTALALKLYPLTLT
jgi:hypothetical protein